VEVDAPVAAVADVEVEPVQLLGQAGAEPEHVLAGLKAGVATLGQVNGAGHGAQVDASAVVPPWTSWRSEASASAKNRQDRCRSERASTQAFTTPDRVEPWEVRSR
jgi:hypothetical protein